MKKKFLSLFICTAVFFSLTACGKEEVVTTEESTIEETTEASTTQEPEETQEDDSDVQIEVVDNTTWQPSEEFEAALANAEIYGNSDGRKFKNWAEAYEKTIDRFVKEIPEYDFTYALIYVNDDEIPELLINSHNDEIGVYLITYTESDGTVNVSATDGPDFTYIPKKNVLNCSGFRLGADYNCLISIRDGQWVQLAYGEQGTLDPWAEDSYDENGNVIVNSWTWNGQELGSEDAYAETFLKYYSYGVAEIVDEYYSYDEIISQIDGLK